MGQFKIMAYDEGQFVCSPDFNVNELGNGNIVVGINPTLLYKVDNDVVGARLSIEYLHNEKEILGFKLLLTILAEGWNDLIKRTSSEEEKRNFQKPLWNLVLDYARGALGAKTKGTPFEKLFLPSIDIDDFVNSVTIQKVE